MAYRIAVDFGREPSLSGSKLGGVPYWDSHSVDEYPRDCAGSMMILLAQVNLSDFPVDEIPGGGLLQFFISAEGGSYGADFSSPEAQTVQSGFRVVRHLSVDPSVTRASLSASGIPCGTASCGFPTPVLEERALTVFRNSRPCGGSGILVDAEFTGGDPRRGKLLSRYGTVLLQLDSVDGAIMWGDCGTGAFFIGEENLRAGNFSDVLYNWDCC